jgi:hypothetical protein
MMRKGSGGFWMRVEGGDEKVDGGDDENKRGDEEDD